MSLKLARFREIAFPVIAVWVVLLLAVTPLFSAVQAKPAEQTALLVSDDFSGCALNTSLWTAIDPVGDGTISLDGENLVFTIPTGSIHTLTGTGMTDYQYTVTRIMQPSNNTSFEAEAKFVTGVSHKYEMQGIVVQDNDSNLLRIEFFSEGRNTVLYVAKIVNGARSDLRRVNIGAPGLAPLYLKVNRTGLTWTISWKTDGSEWTSLPSFDHTLRSNQVGLYSGSTADEGQTAPGNTTRVDYFFNTAAPITPEDGNKNSIDVVLNGQGTVTRSPDKTSYACGENVDLTAVPDPGWTFVSLSGSGIGGNNPTATVTVTGKMTVTANFAPGSGTLENSIFLPLMSR